MDHADLHLRGARRLGPCGGGRLGARRERVPGDARLLLRGWLRRALGGAALEELVRAAGERVGDALCDVDDLFDAEVAEGRADCVGGEPKDWMGQVSGGFAQATTGSDGQSCALFAMPGSSEWKAATNVAGSA